MSDTKKILVALAAGVAIGAIAGVLLAPDKGSATRKKIIEEGENLADALKEKAEALKEKFTECKEKCHDVKEAIA